MTAETFHDYGKTVWEEARRRLEALRRKVVPVKRDHYRAVFLDADAKAPSVDGEMVLGDLRRFCCAENTTFRGDRDMALILEGRRQTWLRITNFLNLSDEQVARLKEVEDDYRF